MSFQYQIYGLRLTSSRKIALLSEKSNAATDLSVFWTVDNTETPDPLLDWKQILTNDLKKRRGISLFRAQIENKIFSKLRFDTEENGYIEFILSAGDKKLWTIHSQYDTPGDLDSYFVGPVLGCMLRLLGVVCLHASVINLDNRAVIIAGKKRGGKSTTAAAFARLGYKVLADDLAVVTPKISEFQIEAGYPKVRLRPKSLAAIHSGNFNSFPTVYSHRDSRYSDLDDGFCETALPLGAIYILGELADADAAPYVETVSPQEKLIRLNENTFGNYAITPDMRKREFEILSRLAIQVPIRRLLHGFNLQTLNLQCEAIIKDFRRTAE